MTTWDPSLGFVSFRNTTRAIAILLHCICAAISTKSKLTPSQVDTILRWGKQQLARVHVWLQSLEWTGLHQGCLATSRGAAAVLAFPHIASHHLVRMIIEPLTALCSMPGGCALVSEELVSSVEHMWSSARLAYPDSVNPDASFVWCTGLDCIEMSLRELRTALESSREI